MLELLRRWFIRSFTKVVRQYWVDGVCIYTILAGGGKFYIKEGQSGLILFKRPYITLQEAVTDVGRLAEANYGNNPHYSLADGIPSAKKIHNR